MDPVYLRLRPALGHAFPNLSSLSVDLINSSLLKRGASTAVVPAIRAHLSDIPSLKSLFLDCKLSQEILDTFGGLKLLKRLHLVVEAPPR